MYKEQQQGTCIKEILNMRNSLISLTHGSRDQSGIKMVGVNRDLPPDRTGYQGA